MSLQEDHGQDGHACPCCGYLTFGEPPWGSYVICPVCAWEDDPVQLADPTYEGGANIVSLEQGRRNFEDSGASDPALAHICRAPLQDEKPRIMTWNAETVIDIDGAEGEGGGQVLRSALSLAMVTGRGFRIENIRGKRARPGLLRQHLTAVRAAQAICGARVEGAALGATALAFDPGPVVGGTHSFAIGTAGSTTLVAQTLLPALLTAGQASSLTFEGGTHNPHAPPFDFLDRAFLPLIRRMGAKVEATLRRPGFYPAGGGLFALRIEPVEALAPLELTARGAPRRKAAEAVVANLDPGIAQRELQVVRKKLNWPDDCLEAREEQRNPGPGNVLVATLDFENVTEVFTGFGQVGVSAESVGNGTVQAVQRYLKRDAAVGPYLADQLLLPLALAGGGRFTTGAPSLHTRTNVAIIERFLPLRFAVTEGEGGVWTIAVEGY